MRFFDILMLNDILTGIIKTCCQMKERKKYLLLFEMTFLHTSLHYGSFRRQQIILYWKVLKWQAVSAGNM